MPGKLIIYTLQSCATSQRAKADLAADGIEYEERDVGTNAAFWEEATELAMSVPIIVRDGKVELGWKGEHG